MSRIYSSECEYLDIQWYGIDKEGNIAVFCTGTAGNLPEFVCESSERADKLTDYFEKLEKTTDSVLIFSKTEAAQKNAADFSDKGLYYFDADDGTDTEICTLHKYCTKHSCPQKALKYEQLPENIKEIISHNFMDIENFSLADTINVKHAYK